MATLSFHNALMERLWQPKLVLQKRFFVSKLSAVPCLSHHLRGNVRGAPARKLNAEDPSENFRSCATTRFDAVPNRLVWNRRRSCSCRSKAEDSESSESTPGQDVLKDQVAQDRRGDTLWMKSLENVGTFVGKNFLLVALLSSVVLGLAFPGPGRAAQKLRLTNWCTGAIFVLSGLNLRPGDSEKALAAWPAGLLGLISILAITPLAAIPILRLKSSPPELIAGLAIFACVPTTLSSAVSLTQIAGANATLALAMTVTSNLISIVTMPFTLTTMVGAGLGVTIPPGPLLRSLIETLLVPLVLGKVLREAFSGVGRLVDANRRRVSMLSSFILSLVPYMQLSAAKDRLLEIEPSNLLFVIAAGLVLHAVYLTINSGLMAIWPSKSTKIDYNSRAVLLVASQKSIIVTIAVIDKLGGAFGNAGLLVLPCIAAQLSQVMVDSILVNKWLQSSAGKEQATVPA